MVGQIDANFGQRLLENLAIIDQDAKMENTRPIFLQKSAPRAGCGCWLKQFQHKIAQLVFSHLNAFILNWLSVGIMQNAVGENRFDGFFWLAGQGGYGIQTSPALARLAASLATRRDVDGYILDEGLDPASLSPTRL